MFSYNNNISNFLCVCNHMCGYDSNDFYGFYVVATKIRMLAYSYLLLHVYIVTRMHSYRMMAEFGSKEKSLVGKLVTIRIKTRKSISIW